MEEIEELMEEAENPPSNDDLADLGHKLHVLEQQSTPPRVVEDPDDYILTSDSTLLRMQRYSEQNSSSSNDPEWGEEMSDNYYTGSEETSGGEKLDFDLPEDESNDES